VGSPRQRLAHARPQRAHLQPRPRQKGAVHLGDHRPALHVAPKQRPEIVTTAPGTIDPASPIVYSPDGQQLYFFQNVQPEDNYGDLYHIALPPTGNGQMHLISRRASTVDFNFTAERLLYMRNISTTGDAGDLIDSRFDGSDERVMAQNAATADLQIAYPEPVPPTLKPGQGFYKHPLDLSMPPVPAIFSNLVNAARDTSANIKLVDSSRPVVGALAFGQGLGQPEVAIDPAVQAGRHQFTDDGRIIVYVGSAQYSAKSFNYVGKLQLFQTQFNTQPDVPMLDGVSELGPIGDRAMFVSAPAAPTPGIYLVKF
jgi:hypothetical protein